MTKRDLSPLATASRDLVFQLAKGAHPDEVEAGCRDLLTNNTNGLGTVDTRVVEVASEIVRGVLSGVAMLRSPAITAATRGVSDTGKDGDAGDAERLDISERVSRDVRDSHDASRSDYTSALEGAAPAARMTTDELRTRVDEMPPRKNRNK
ncbi:MAG: hypothetical protein EA380_07915 [Phycisphaeraceae bacterium]|nr:MAG: hypothetical protein EA380_07915 [Phycisphaeraceae bacterium]